VAGAERCGGGVAVKWPGDRNIASGKLLARVWSSSVFSKYAVGKKRKGTRAFIPPL
jgi:hypothetical protein